MSKSAMTFFVYYVEGLLPMFLSNLSLKNLEKPRSKKPIKSIVRGSVGCKLPLAGNGVTYSTIAIFVAIKEMDMSEAFLNIFPDGNNRKLTTKLPQLL